MLRRLRWTARRISGSLTVRLGFLLVIFAALPFILYGQFETADRKEREIVTKNLRYSSWLIAQALKPLLNRESGPPTASLNEELAKYGGDGTNLKLMFQPKGGAAGQDGGFYFLASAPKVDAADLGAILDNLQRHGIVSQVAESCTWDKPVDIRYTQPTGHEEILTSVVPIQSRWGCWVLVSSHVTSELLATAIGRPYWQTPQVRLSLMLYLAVAVIALLTALSVRRHIRHFRHVAREIRQGRVAGNTFASRNAIPELDSVARDFDGLVHDLHHVAGVIRQTAEDNAHSFKGPVATIQACLEPLKRLIPAEHARGKRAAELIELSLDRLKALISASQCLDNTMADMIESPREAVDLTQIVADILKSYREVLVARQIRLSRQLPPDVLVRAGKVALAVVVENILDNAVSFTPDAGAIAVRLQEEDGVINLTIEDSGPGIDPDKIDNIFDRYFSLRPPDHARRDAKAGSPGHAGLGLWIVKRNVEALGGTVTATNRIGGGLKVHIVLPSVT
ncbi:MULTISPECIES: sensor histidine kinase [Nitrospirillum]|uniref:histidine kinase n=1 Tax=Nitrospirillum amazonense TaxID=28077 RepID=A0A560GDR5_9PROT|nr:HAMP domain-containing sensor histidine kinase [Nitrospirillum amazonense]MEC4592247.1 HAMP domain-containing sensor histidine kinase [Nitrospirillum amazonense]TWB31969.1 two-component system sensor histidine kinase ChvG [Nitrospirillum amazonense]